MAAFAVVLSACSGSNTAVVGPVVPVVPGAPAAGLGASTVTRAGANQATRIGYDATTDEMIIESIPFDDAVFEGRYARTATMDRGAYRAYTSTNGTDTFVAYFDESATGAVKGGVVGSDVYLNHGYGGATYARTGSVTLPSTSQATYNGDYIGLRTNAKGGPMDVVTGVAAMKVDFSDSTVRGEINSRTIAATTDLGGVGGRPAVRAIITFANAGLDKTNGSFNGAISTTGVDGNCEGLLADGATNASEMAGIVLLTEGDNQENGTFIATK